jgi:hypothetical protein
MVDRRRLGRAALFSVLAAALVGWLGAGGARAAGGYPAGAAGTTIGSAQCGSDFPASPDAFAIIAVTGGRAFYQNACLVSEYHWAQAATNPASFYLNLNAPAGTTSFKGLTGPKGACQASDQGCQAYNYGYNAAQAAFADAQSQGTTAPAWWLDIETGNTWSESTALNDQTIQGAIDFLQAQGISVGLYSTAEQWQQIAGSFAPGLPNWAAGAPDAGSAAGFCTASHSFGGGGVQLVQYPASIGDGVLVCSSSGVQPAAAAPAAPEGVVATAVDASTIALSWTEATPAVTGFAVTDGSAIVGQTSGAITSLTLGALSPGSYHCYAVVASNGAGYSPYSAYACATTPSTP